ncbi:hypothetical protein AcW1_001413 [Taiwanofungus camphoratus]|nr:hypothetical protein AcW2_000058 [Antrodia cinnamomea]KAI0964640.1 hypothetical protein AcW1_001413 [Antrodia cinnamomea]
MSFVRAAAFSTRAVRFQLGNASRRYSTAPPPEAKKPSNLPLYLGGAGIAGLAGYIYFTSGSKKAEVKQEKSPLDPNNFIDLELKRVEPYNHNTAKFILSLPDNQASLMPVASCVYLRPSEAAPNALKDDKGKLVQRPYTPVSLPDERGELTFLVKKYDEGKLSKYIHELKSGEKLSIKGPIMKFQYKINEFDEVGMVAGGSGITPMYQILKYALTDPSNKTKFTLIFANITEKDILLREEFEQMKKEHPDKFNIVYTVDKADASWKGYKGYVNNEMIKQHIAPPQLGNKVKIFVCGPPGQLAAVAGKKDGIFKQGPVGGILKELGYTEDQVRRSGSDSPRTVHAHSVLCRSSSSEC